MLSKFILFIVVLLFYNASSHLTGNNFLTYYEIHDQNRTPSYDNTVAFSKQLAAASNMLHYEVFGKSHQGRDIPLLIFNKNGQFTPGEAKENNSMVILIQAAIHPGEPVGKDAGLMLLRDLVIHEKHLEYLENTTVLFIPILNPDGHERFGPYNRINQNGPEEMGWRTNARNLNLNRDYLKADSKEMRALLRLWHNWDPDFFIDTHSTNGGDYQYTMTYAMDVFGNANTSLVEWINDFYLPEIYASMEQDGFPLFPYVTYRSWHDPRSGLISGAWHPMYSNSYASELNRPGLLLETHMLKPYNERVESTYLMILHTFKLLQKDHDLKKLIKKADQYTASPQFREQEFDLRFEVTSDSVMVDFLGVEYKIKESSLSGGNWFIYNPEEPRTYQIPWFNQTKPVYSVKLPDAYIIPVEYHDVIERLDYHNIRMKKLEKDTLMKVSSWRFEEVQLASRSNEGRQTASFKTVPITEERVYHKGSVLISMDQPGARIIAHALEPMAPGSFAYWGFFNAVFERVEYFESYVMEEMAREMIANDPSLMQGLQSALTQNPEMASRPYAILSWFYEQTPYYDQRHNIYPIGRIFNEAPIKPSGN